LDRLFYTFAFSIIFICSLNGQTNEKEQYVQLSGIITDESYKPVPGVAVVSKKLHKGSVSERTGIYSITTMPGDTVFFRALGFKRYHTIIPLTYEERHCKVDIALEIDTIQIEGITILPWSSYQDFIKDVTREKPVDPIIENMNENIASIYVAIANQANYMSSPEAAYHNATQQNFNSMSTRNQYPVNNLLNPFAWAKFIKGVKNGLFKNQQFTKPINAKVRKKVKNPNK
jgi:hypothetical protein